VIADRLPQTMPLAGARRFACAALIACALPDLAAANDSKGNFSMKGAGYLTCQVMVAERSKRSEASFLIGGWIEGYISAYNRYVEDTYDVTPFESLELLLTVMQKHCEKHPNDRVHAVLNSMLTQLHPDRLRTESERVKITEGKRTTILYRETISRMQTELKQRGLYRGAIDGRYTDATRSALIAFQSDIKFDTTGFPDQTTLWRLLRK